MSGPLALLTRRLRFKLPGAALVIAIPYTWLALFLFVPFLIVLKISFATSELSTPPYSSLWQVTEDNILQFSLHLGNYGYLLTDDLYVFAYMNAVKNALVSTVICLLLGYPMAYAIARSRPGLRTVLLMLVVMPFWTSFLIRIYAWIGILKDNGLINNFLIWLGVITEPITMLYTPFSVYVGMTYGYLPFMILPLFAALEKLDGTLLEAAADLGAKPITTFFKITLPLSMPGVVAGSLLVFIPACGEYVIPTLLGGPDTLMIGNVLANEFFENRDWPVASAVAILLLLVLIVPIMWFQNLQQRSRDKVA